MIDLQIILAHTRGRLNYMPSQSIQRKAFGATNAAFIRFIWVSAETKQTGTSWENTRIYSMYYTNLSSKQYHRVNSNFTINNSLDK